MCESSPANNNGGFSSDGWGNYRNLNNAPKEELWTAQNFQMQYPPTMTRTPIESEVGRPVFQLSPYANGRAMGTDIIGNIIRFRVERGLVDRMVQTATRVRDYYEVTVRSKSMGACVGVGFASTPYPPFRLPGWERNSIAIHSDTGNKFFNDSHHGVPYASGFSSGDVIGCGYTPSPDGANYAFYFTKNGKHLGNAFTTSYLNGETYACVGADGVCELDVNFGERPFKFVFGPNPAYNLHGASSGSTAPSAPQPYAPPNYVQPIYAQPSAPPPPNYAPPSYSEVQVN
jgi:hypothetical protein